MTNPRSALDLASFIQSAPQLAVVLDPDLNVVAANDALLRATGARREDLVGRNLFEVSPANQNAPWAAGERKLPASIEGLSRTATADNLPMQRYDVRLPPEQGGEFVIRYWN